VGVDPVQEQSGHERVMVGEMPVQRLGQLGDLGPHSTFGQLGDHRRLRVALLVDQRLQHQPAGHPGDVGGHRGQN